MLPFRLVAIIRHDDIMKHSMIIRTAGIWIVTGMLAWGQVPERFPILGGDGFAVETVLIEPSEFTQGSPDQEEGRKADEGARKVTLTRPFLLGKYPVTVGEFRQFTRETGYKD